MSNLFNDKRGMFSGVWLVPVLVAFLFHVPALFCSFVYDDIPLVLENKHLSSVSFLSTTWTSDYGLEFAGEARGFYRPVFMTLVYLVHRLAGPSPFVFHLVSLVIFSFAVALVARVVAVVDSRGSRMLPVIAGVLYAVHPARVETVSIFTSLPDLLVEICALSLVYLLLRRLISMEHGARWHTPAACGAISLAAVLCKESACFIIPAMAAAFFLLSLGREAGTRNLMAASAGAMLMGTTAGYLARLLAGVHAPFTVPLLGTILGCNSGNVLSSLLLCMKEIVVPGPVVFWRQLSVQAFPGSVLLVLFVFAVAGWIWFRSVRNKDNATGLLVAWIGANLLSLAVLTVSGYPYSQRYVAVAPMIIALCLIARSIYDLVLKNLPPIVTSFKSRYASLILISYLAVHGGYTLAGSVTCLTPLSFFLAMQEANPSEVIPLGAVAQTLNKERRDVHEVEYYVRCAANIDRSHPQVPLLQNILIRRYLDDGLHADALRCAEWSLGMYSNDTDKMALRSVALASMGRFADALESIDRALRLQPRNEAYLRLRQEIAGQWKLRLEPGKTENPVR